ncbi:DMT family transporter [Staphylococcus pseudoxylosus]|uniref:Uncharacterized protein n=1 Tax=Staphylococcus pseudoxylosus TaxID=2282419 RepID=A0AAQ0S6C0_9STAP|nr:DMT family transporter [Staphylococcus pseudoxylosus]MCE5002151.1 DMT family transporter [Staphylococcus pseudoxylosus]RMI84704.1 hypothetical protein D9V42_09205 [Staphylococcus pseudoxylosus]
MKLFVYILAIIAGSVLSFESAIYGKLGENIGQLAIGIIIDHFGWFDSLVIHFEWRRFIALLFMAIALYFIYKGNLRSKNDKVKLYYKEQETSINKI